MFSSRTSGFKRVVGFLAVVSALALCSSAQAQVPEWDPRTGPSSSPDTTVTGILFETLEFDDNFNALGLGFTPPNPMGAAGPNGLVTVAEIMIEMLNLDGTTRYQTDLITFFSQSTGYFGATPVTPKVLYDQYQDRFLVVAFEVETIQTGGTPGLRTYPSCRFEDGRSADGDDGRLDLSIHRCSYQPRHRTFP